MRVEDVVAHPPLGDLLSSAWQRWVPRLGRVLRLFVVVWPLLVTACGGWLLVHVGRNWLAAREQEEAKQALEARARPIVGEIVRGIGHGVTVSSVEVGDMPDFAGAYYEAGGRRIVFSDHHGWSDLELMTVGGHECVHAIFDQAGLSRYGDLDAELLEETTATVLGAYLAGRVAARHGRNGEAIVRQVVHGLKAACSPGFGTPKGWLAQQVLRGRLSRLDHKEVRAVLDHFGNERLINEVDRICSEHPDAWEAAHAVAEHFGLDQPGGPHLPKACKKSERLLTDSAP